MFEDYNDIQLLGMLIWGEARGEPIEGKIAVACTVRNRVNRPRWWGRNYRDVILCPWQYSCFNENDPNRDKLVRIEMSDEIFVECLWIANGVITNMVRDNTSGSTHYHTHAVLPRWAPKMDKKATLNRHIFYRER